MCTTNSQPIFSNIFSIKDAFGAHLDNEEHVTLPGTPLPSLVQNFEPDDVSPTTETQPPTPPAEKSQVRLL